MADQPIDDGGPAFPCKVDITQPLARQVDNLLWQTYGLTMRDWFAGKALEGWLASGPSVGRVRFSEPLKGGDVEHAETVATSAYLFADAMLRARKAPHAD